MRGYRGVCQAGRAALVLERASAPRAPRPPAQSPAAQSLVSQPAVQHHTPALTARMLPLLLLLLAAGALIAQDKPRVGPDGRPLLNKPRPDMCKDRWRLHWAFGLSCTSLCVVGSTTRSTVATTTSSPGGSPGTSSRTGTGAALYCTVLLS